MTRLLLTRPDNLTDKQRSLLKELTTACPEMIDLADLVRSFAILLTSREGNAARLEEWITARSADLSHLHAFTRGLDQDRDPVRAALTLPFHNGAPKA